MIVTHKVTIDLLNKGSVPQIEAMQDDQYTRDVAITLLTGEEPWLIPEDVSVVIRYGKPDDTGGEYDTLPDGSCAWSISGNVLTLALAPQVLTVPGNVRLSATLIRDAQILTVFSLFVKVRARVGFSFAESASYYNVMGFLPGPVNAQAGQYLRVAQVDDTGRVVAVEGADLSGGTSSGTEDWSQEGFDYPASRDLDMSGYNIENVRLLEAVDLCIMGHNSDIGVFFAHENTLYTDGQISGQVLGIYGSHGDEKVVLRNIHDPISNSDAASKQYVDEAVQKAAGSGGNVELDTTLTEEGKAADAKAVGDALANVGQPTQEQVSAAVNDYLAENPVSGGGGISTGAINLLIEILQVGMFTTNVSGKIESLKEALLAGSSGDSGGSGDGGGSTVADEITFTDGMLTIISVGSDVSVADGMLTIL